MSKPLVFLSAPAFARTVYEDGAPGLEPEWPALVAFRRRVREELCAGGELDDVLAQLVDLDQVDEALAVNSVDGALAVVLVAGRR